jgi:hypothetical protein
MLLRSGDRTTEVQLGGDGTEVLWIPLTPSPDGHFTIAFAVDSMFVPSIHRGSADTRELGVLVKSVAALSATEDEVPITATSHLGSGFPRALRRQSRRLARAFRG